MAPQPWGRLSLAAWLARREPGPPDVDGPARHAGRRRRFVLLALSLAPAVYATRMRNMVLWSMDENARAHGEDAYTWRFPGDFVRLAPRDVPKTYRGYMAEIGLEVPER